MTVIPSPSTRATHLDTIITSHILLVVTSLLLLLALLWHMSTSQLIDTYDMPEEWTEDFLGRQFRGARGVLWGFMFVLGIVDYAHGLLAMDWYHECRYERRDDGGRVRDTLRVLRMRHDQTRKQEKEQIQLGGTVEPPTNTLRQRHRTSSRSTTTTMKSPSVEEKAVNDDKSVPFPPLPKRTPRARTVHPFFSYRLRPWIGFYLHAVYDVLVVGLLVTFVVSLFKVWGENREACYDEVSLAEYPPPVPLKSNLTLDDRCHRITTNTHVSGAFSTALFVLLIALHIFHLIFRIYVCLRYEQTEYGRRMGRERGGSKPGNLEDGRNGMGGDGMWEDVVMKYRMDGIVFPLGDVRGGDGGEDADADADADGEDIRIGAGDGVGLYIVDSGTGVRFKDWSVEGRERRIGDMERGGRWRFDGEIGDEHGEMEVEGWSMLECLVP